MADLIDEIRAIAAKIEKSSALVQTEEATKNAFVMPFISALGYDVFDPSEVTPELVADVGTKKGEKIDYAILIDGKPAMLFECKSFGKNLDNEHASQLFRYFSVSEARIAILTNGNEYRFFSDLDDTNKMDSKPFLVFRISDFDETLIPELKRLSRSSFDLESVLSTANELKFMREIKSLLAQQLTKPSEDFVKFCSAGIGVKPRNSSQKEQFIEVARRAFNAFIADRLSEKLKTALGASAPSMSYDEQPSAPDASSEQKTDLDSQINTTVDELEGFYIVKSILRDLVDTKRIVHRDQKSYFGILLDDNNRKPLARLHFNTKQKYLGVFSDDKVEERIQIDSVDDIYAHAMLLRDSAKRYL